MYYHIDTKHKDCLWSSEDRCRDMKADSDAAIDLRLQEAAS
jgi:hypothetical protein